MLSADQVIKFKTIYCDENAKIIRALRALCGDLIRGSVLDVGAGSGEVSMGAFPHNEIWFVDSLAYSPCAREESRVVVGDFLTTKLPLGGYFDLALFSHVLQYLQRDVKSLVRRVSDLEPSWIATVLNTNSDLLGRLILFLETQGIDYNAEVALEDFPGKSYSRFRSNVISANLVCPDFDVLTDEVSYLCDASWIGLERDVVREFLVRTLSAPEFSIEQEVVLYRKL